jgi:hypothetical protein
MKKAIIVPNYLKSESVGFCHTAKNLLEGMGYTVEVLAESDAPSAGADFAMVLGGDGTILRACKKLYQLDIPVFGINFGNVGYLTACNPDTAIECINKVVGGEYKIEKRIMLNGSEYNCRSVNPDYTVTEIYRIPYSDEEKDLVERIRFSIIEPKAKSLTEAMYMKIKTNPCEPTFENALDSIKQLKEENPQFFGLARKSSTLNNVEIVEDIEELEKISLPPMVKLSLSQTKYLVEERFKKDPVVQYNLQLLKEKEAELKEKKEEYLKMRNWDNDDVMISLSASSTLDIEEYKEKIEDLKDEIEDLKDEIEELRNELEEIKEEIEAEVEDEG